MQAKLTVLGFEMHYFNVKILVSLVQGADRSINTKYKKKGKRN